MTNPNSANQPGQDAAGDLAGALDMLLADGALGVLRRFRPDGAALRLAVRLARRPQRIASEAALLGAELARIAGGRSEVAPDRRDRRFADPAWKQNPLLYRAMQAYLAACWPVPTSTGATRSGCGSS
jgi:polyhydroxyalkanoate synthase